MKKKFSLKKLGAIGAGVTLALSLAFGMAFTDFSDNTVTTDEANAGYTQTVEPEKPAVSNYAVSSNTVVNDSASGLATYANGDKFWYTNYADGVKLGDKVAGVTTDRITKTVDSSKTKGSIDNPWVIKNTEADWNKFVAYVANRPEKGLNEVFVLNGDIDYAGKAITSVVTFKGWFLGSGYTISNTKYNPVTNEGLGLFCNALGTSAYFADLTIKNVTTNSTIGLLGGLVAHSEANLTCAGITVTGSFTCVTPTMINTASCNNISYFDYGGIVGKAHGKDRTINFYKCSANVTYTLTNDNGNWTGAGGILADADGSGNAGCVDTGKVIGSGAAVNMYDCYCAVKTTYSTTKASASQLWTGMLSFVRVVRQVTMKRCMVVYDLTVTGASDYIGAGLILVEAQRYDNIDAKADNYVLDYCYGYGNWSLNGKKYAMPLVGKHHSETANSTKVTNCKVFSDNKSYFQYPTTAGTFYATIDLSAQMGAATNKSPATSLEQFKQLATGITHTYDKDGNVTGTTVTNANAPFGNPAIWSEAAIYDIKSTTSTPNIVDEPVVVSKTRITFQELNGTNIALAAGASNPSEYELSEGGIAALPLPVEQTGKSFAGWTLDKTSDKNATKTFPKNLYGNVFMFPVWDMTGVTVQVTAEVKEGSATVEDHDISAKYIGEPVVTLTAAITSAPCDLEKATVSWSWYMKKAGEDEVKIDGATSNVLELTELTNATYYAKVSIVDQSVLWRTNPAAPQKSANEFNIVIEKGVLAPNGGIELMATTGAAGQEKDVFAYWGQKLDELTNLVSVNMQNTAGGAVAGRIEWVDPLTRVADTQKTYPAKFIPNDTDNYVEETDINVTILPTILQRIYEFKISDSLPNQTFAFNEQYETVYTKAQVAQTFEDSYFDWLNTLGASDGKYQEMVGRMPYFGTENIMQYRKGTDASNPNNVGASFAPAFVANDSYIVKDKENNTATLTIPVSFNTRENSTKFTISLYNTVLTNKFETTTQTLGYGDVIDKPVNTVLVTNGNTSFLTGWFKSGGDGSLAEDREEWEAWDFTNDRVTGIVNLTADWMSGYLKLISIDARVNGSSRTFVARSVPKPSDYVVQGTYKVYGSKDEADAADYDADDGKQSVALTLSPDDYIIDVGASNVYHVYDANPDGTNFTVTVKAKADLSRTSAVNVKVTPMRLDMSGIFFPNKSLPYNGEMQSIGEADVDTPLSAQGVSKDSYTVSYVYHDSNDKAIPGSVAGVSEIGTYYVYIVISFRNTNDFAAGSVSATFTITEKPTEVYVSWNADNKKEYTYNGQVQHPEAAFYRLDGEGGTVPVTISFVYTGNSEQINANADGAYSRVSIALRNSRYVLADDAVTTIEFRINRAKIALPQLTNNSFEYKAAEYDISEYIGYDADTLEFLVLVRNGKAKDVPSSGTITSQVELRDPVNSEWEDGSSGAKQIVWTITAKVMTVPTFTETLVYSGFKYVVSEHLNFYDPVITVFGAETEATDAGIYRANLRLPTENGGKNYVWANKDFNGTVDWQIQKAELYLTWDAWSYLYNGSTFSPRAKVSFGLVDADAPLMNQDPRFIYTGDADKRESGSYKMEVEIGQSSALYKNYMLAKDSATFYWVIKESSSEVVITVVWDIPADGGYLFNDEIQYPKVKALYSENGMGEEDLDKYIINYTGDWNKSKYRGTYTVGVEITAEDGTPLRIRQGEATYVIRRNNGIGDDPNAGQTTQPGVDPGTVIDPPSNDTVNYPVVQLIIGGVGAVLLVVFTIKTMGYASSTKEAKKKTKELAQISYSFALPFALLAVGDFLGLGDTAWWGISIGIFALAILMGAAMFVFRSKNKKALAALAEEQTRVDDEKEAAKERAEYERELAREEKQAAQQAQMRAEQQRRDDEFRMMFAAMQQNYSQPAVNYDDMQNMISSAVAGLLPTMQQQMQALPPAQSETDDLRALMQQQQEMLNQLMQERQVHQDYQPPVNDMQGGAQDYEELKRIIAQQEQMINGFMAGNNSGDEQFTLEELYGKLDDDKKRYYYEIGGYIMSKPDTAQNDGKYAVLFKHRNKTLFKLCIKNDAPVLYYTSDTDMQGEIVIRDNSMLEMAKSIVDLRIMQTDRE